ncbi:hypothetical protein, partial [Mesorhizobium sp.]|uniref:hypothetical protein n=1 Tax=Mesorhizobium sp. TaxID=1871066 RepID=UPI00257F2CA0
DGDGLLLFLPDVFRELFRRALSFANKASRSLVNGPVADDEPLDAVPVEPSDDAGRAFPTRHLRRISMIADGVTK